MTPSKSGSVLDPDGTENTWSLHPEAHDSQERASTLQERGGLQWAWEAKPLYQFPHLVTYLWCLLCARCQGNEGEQTQVLLSRSSQPGIPLKN